ncbi:MAG: Asp-tRNA(Asn)/Glu-tRNA(Gln) amidotransferase subunit GatA [Candidatus Aenigmarchaeota archaeon]|nr:Asp-tRNA(Asn)/Glu-tRNA(Gln) amidotransferase subunit GatA [Candidatus Aenigmarchaeota archaeon]
MRAAGRGYGGMTARQFVREAQGGLDLREFYSEFFSRLHALQQDYRLLVTMAEQAAWDALPASRPGPLRGLPFSVKDNICTQGIQSTAGSRILEGYIPPFDATAVARTKHAGGILVGKTQMDEFGFGTFSTNSGYGVPKNPLDPSRSCGGSSGGAAGLVRALDLPHVAMAESTGGSISCPAAFCGVVGLTPTYGLVSRWGLIDYANSLDKIGVLARSVDDCALLLEQMEGFDTKDSTSLKRARTKDYRQELDLRKVKIGLPKEYFQGVDAGIARTVQGAVDALEREGAKVQEVSLPHTKYALAAYYVIATAEASTNLAKYCGMRYGQTLPLEGKFNEFFSRVRTRYFGDEAKRRIILGTFARMAGYRDQLYLKAFQARTLVIRDFERAFKQVDVLAAPTMPLLAPKFSEIASLTPVEHYQMDILTVAPNLAGIPQLSLPCGELQGLPVGLHLLADHLNESALLGVGRAWERLTRPVEEG